MVARITELLRHEGALGLEAVRPFEHGVAHAFELVVGVALHSLVGGRNLGARRQERYRLASACARVGRPARLDHVEDAANGAKLAAHHLLDGRPDLAAEAQAHSALVVHAVAPRVDAEGGLIDQEVYHRMLSHYVLRAPYLDAPAVWRSGQVVGQEVELPVPPHRGARRRGLAATVGRQLRRRRHGREERLRHRTLHITTGVGPSQQTSTRSPIASARIGYSCGWRCRPCSCTPWSWSPPPPWCPPWPPPATCCSG